MSDAILSLLIATSWALGFMFGIVVSRATKT